MRTVKFMAGIAVLSIVLTACLQEPHPGPASTHVYIGVGESNADYVEGEPIGLTVHFAAKDQRLHGLAESGPFIANSRAVASANMEMSAWVGVDADQQVFECFGPIEIRDEQSQPVLSIADFCPSDLAQLTISGDVRTGTDVRWEFRGRGGEQVVHLNDQ